MKTSQVWQTCDVLAAINATEFVFEVRCSSIGLWYNVTTLSLCPWRRQMDESKVDIEVESFKRVDVVTVDGRIDSSNASQLDEAFNGLTEEGRYQLVADLSGVEYMSSAGLRALVAVLRECKKHRGDVRIASPSERMQEVLNLAGLNSVFTVYDDTTAAVGSY